MPVAPNVMPSAATLNTPVAIFTCGCLAMYATSRDAEHPGGHFYVRLFGDVRHQLLRNRRAVQTEKRGGLRPHQNVRADASRALLRILNEPVAEAHQAEDQRHRYADQQDTEQAAHRPVF